ncbi:MAG: hypothetical protein KGO49_11170 [Gammaproteobacteria bacterium]|nr:hypothetical protein [Gammaproteobacteria bacterium]
MKYNFHGIRTLTNKHLASYTVLPSHKIIKNKYMIKNNNQLTITTDRDSVCAGDDCRSHNAEFSIKSSCTIIELLKAAWQTSPLASISGGKATWLIDISSNIGEWMCIGVMAEQWTHPRLTIPEETTVEELFKDQKLSLYFRYWCQIDPEIVYESVRLGQPLPKK